MLITLAFLPLKVSMMLAAFLTLLLMALALTKRSLWVSGLAMALIGMTWRAESWKAAYREIAQQASQLPPQYRQLLPKIMSVRQDAWPAYDDARRAPQFSSNRLLGLLSQSQPRSLVRISIHSSEGPFELREAVSALQVKYQDPIRDKLRILSHCRSQTGFYRLLDLSQAAELNCWTLEIPYRSWPNTNQAEYIE